MNQFPQPTRPINSYNFENTTNPSEPVNMSFESSSHDNFEPQTAGGEGGEEKETLDELLEHISEWYEKLPDSIRRQLNLRIHKGPSNNINGFRVNSTKTRGVNGPFEEMKLERFKIRTVQHGGVVQVDEEDSQQQQQFQIPYSIDENFGR